MNKEFDEWQYNTWRKDALPAWRRVLEEAIAKGQTKRAEYARWILTDILKAPEALVGLAA